MITLHHLEHSRSQRILWLLEEIGCEYEIRHYKRDAKTYLAPPELRAVHPLGKSPVITDGDTVVAESAVIVDYLVEKFAADSLRPAAGTPAALQYKYWLHYAEGTMAPLLVMSLIFNRIEQAPWLVRPIAKAISAQVKKSYLGPNLASNLAFLQQHLEQNRWFCGEDFSAADVMMSFALEGASQRAAVFAQHPRLGEVLAAMQARPAYRKALEIGGPYSLAG